MWNKEQMLRSTDWLPFPKLRHVAQSQLTQDETEELLRVIAAHNDGNTELNLADSFMLDSAFYWMASPQGDQYWRDIATRLEGETLPAMGGVDVHHEEVSRKGWEPDVVDGASVMDITRSLF